MTYHVVICTKILFVSKVEPHLNDINVKAGELCRKRLSADEYFDILMYHMQAEKLSNYWCLWKMLRFFGQRYSVTSWEEVYF